MAVQLSGLPGVKDKSVEAVGFGSISGALLLIRNYRAVTSAGDHGCINIWKDDLGYLRAEFQCRMITRGEFKGRTKSALKEWLVEWFPKMGR